MQGETALIAIFIMAAVTALIRFAPFLLFQNRKTPSVVVYLGRVLPYAVMGMLVVYCLRDTSFAAVGGFLPQLIAGAITVGSYVWKKNTLLSILLGTVCYMVLVQTVFL